MAYHRILDRGCPPILLHDSFPLITITFSWGSRGFPPGNFSLSSSVNLQNLKTDIHTTFVPFPFCIPPWGCPPILLYHSFTYCHYYSLGGPGGLPLVISLYLLRQFTKPQYRYSHPFFPYPLKYPSLGVSPQSYSIFLFFTYYHYYSLVQGVWVQGVSPWLILSFSCFNLQNLNTYIKRHILSPPW